MLCIIFEERKFLEEDSILSMLHGKLHVNIPHQEMRLRIDS